MSTKTPTGDVLIQDTRSYFPPIRLPIDAIVELHRDTSTTLQAYVAEHRGRFPRGPRRRRIAGR